MALEKTIVMVGNISISVDMGDDQKLVHSFGILHEANPTRILGRDFLRRLGPTEFDWETKRVRLGSVWKKSDAVIEGGDIFARTAVAEI